MSQCTPSMTIIKILKKKKTKKTQEEGIQGDSPSIMGTVRNKLLPSASLRCLNLILFPLHAASFWALSFPQHRTDPLPRSLGLQSPLTPPPSSYGTALPSAHSTIYSSQELPKQLCWPLTVTCCSGHRLMACNCPCGLYIWLS
jgi:hypothetical protein